VFDRYVAPKTEAARLQQRYRLNRDSLYVFLDRDDVEPTNNSSERDLRNSVIHDKVTGGYRFPMWERVMKIQIMIFVTITLLRTREHVQVLMWILAGSVAFYGVKGGLFTLRGGGENLVWGPLGSFIEEILDGAHSFNSQFQKPAIRCFCNCCRCADVLAQPIKCLSTYEHTSGIRKHWSEPRVKSMVFITRKTLRSFFNVRTSGALQIRFA